MGDTNAKEKMAESRKNRVYVGGGRVNKQDQDTEVTYNVATHPEKGRSAAYMMMIGHSFHH
jgi:hypothetical protein